MKQHIRIAIIALSLVMAQNALALGMSAKDIIKKVNQKYKMLKTLQADFQQTFKWELAGETQTIEGSIYLMESSHYRIETATQAIVTDGATVWTYSKQAEQVIIDRLGNSDESQLPKNLLFKYSKDYKPSLLREEKLDGRKIYVLELIPKDEEAFIKSMTIWVDADKWFTRKIEQVDINDNLNTYILSNIREDVELTPDVFQFEIPKEAEIVDLREGE